MTEDNYNYRTSQIMLRNRFPGDGPFRIPIIPKSDFSEVEFRDLRLIGFDRTRIEDEKNLDWMVHFFLYDYKYERVWKEPDRDIERLRRYRAVLSPDFSIYLEMNPTIQLYNTFHISKARGCGSFQRSTGAMKARLTSVFSAFRRGVPLRYRPIWFPSTATTAIRRNSS